MTTRVIVNGAQGRMGRVTCQAINSSAEFHLVAGTSREDDLAALISQHQAQIVIDFTNAHSVYENMQIILKQGARPVVGASGLSQSQIEQLSQHCQAHQQGAIIAPNFSIGAILMMRYAADAARYFDHVEIVEMHHNGKLDSPSGTAIKTAEMIAPHLKPHTSVNHAKETLSGARGAHYENIAIHALRLPGLVAHQQVIFGGLGETFTLKHDSINRECFMPGVLLACRHVLTLDHLVYGLENILDK